MSANYSIKDLEKLSGIKAHTIRIWEQRYNLFAPQRTTTNIRYYSNNDLKLLLNVGLLTRHNYKISHIAELPRTEIERLVGELAHKHTAHDELIERLIVSMISLEEASFEYLISLSLQKFGFEQTFEQILFPFLEKIGIMWQTGAINPAQEHFMSNLIRQKLIVAIDGQTPPKQDAQRFVLFLPEGELHEISLLYYNYLLRSRGIETVYLGQSVPMEDLRRVSEIRKPYAFLTVITGELPNDSLQDYLNALSTAFSTQKIYLSGYLPISQKPLLNKGTMCFTNWQELKKLLN